ncbi:hypothetical protein [Variovorax fucosicus]|uniref:hypothetical protein n=1 Tax=Variovorax fucosicus TaxID=3053517 RepID=UPI002577265E|nr:hypothetical protein [Variovorax sp. J22G21]
MKQVNEVLRAPTFRTLCATEKPHSCDQSAINQQWRAMQPPKIFRGLRKALE